MKRIIFLLLFVVSFSCAGEMALFEKGDAKGDTLLLLGGIHGNERGAYVASSLVALNYEISNGFLIIIPNINMPSIVRDVRGFHGDMNRKFENIRDDDLDFGIVGYLKELIIQPNISLILNLHDGSGFYRDEEIDLLHSPHRWGQSLVIDQDTIKSPKYDSLYKIAYNIKNRVNEQIKNKKHHFHVKNTHTIDGDYEMLKSLSYYAITHKKPSITSETSFEMKVIERIRSHLLVIEETMNMMGIKYKRGFKLTDDGIQKAINSTLDIVIHNVFLPLDDIRSHIKYFPMDTNMSATYYSTDPLISLQKNKHGDYQILHGGKLITTLQPEHHKMSSLNMPISVSIDGRVQLISVPSKIKVRKNFNIKENRYYRINVIGFSTGGEETGVDITKSKILKRFSIDKGGNIFRVEVYEKDSDDFVGTFLVDFSD